MPFFSGRCYSKARLDGKTAVITGCNTGIGKETVLDFYKRGARVIMACRDLTKAEAAKLDITKKCEKTQNLGEIIITKLDLLSLTSVRECANHILATESKINLLINNAGVMMCPKGTTEDGFETQLGTNHFSHFLLTLLLFPRILASKPARIVNVSSKAHEMGSIDFDDLNFEKRSYSPLSAYGQSKLANVLFTKELCKILKERNIEGINVYSLHPGVIATDLGRHLDSAIFPGARSIYKLANWFIKSPELGAQTTIYCAVDEKCENESGLYYSDCVPIRPSREALKPENAERLWKISEKSVGLENWDPLAEDKDLSIIK
ncbi:retinol dehydrogenase 13-like [Arctopsyche grandis]|uniref:retinol dehydrogenase 13-like n=1 Tax=Arctopsyche grandis TaxID=121162 RepID=UPI00406D6F9D